ncbi:MAG: DUF554 domain-containing protein [Clostridia bacterium]|nr:DUF554 domain-containing protein [Clostridia bacterium]
MFGLGTIINVAAIILGGVIGLMGGRKLPERCQETLTLGMGICTLFIGIAGALEEMFTLESGALAAGGTMMLVISVALGGLAGELLDLDGKMERFGVWLRKKSGNDRDSRFLDGFITATMTVCIGAMAIVGSVQDGIRGDYTILAAKSLMDFVIVLVMASSLGKGCIFSAIPVGIFQGSVTLLAKLVEPLLTASALSNLSLVGSVLIFCVGVNLIWKRGIRVANLLPALIVAVAWALLGIG